MNTTGTITMSMRELDRLKVIQAVAERQLKPGRAAERLSLSVRQIERLVLRALSSWWAGRVRWRDEETEIALSRSPFSSRGHQLRRALVFPLPVELA
ncbi:hypothetical protein [Caballeronia sp. TF1N1]|uniref:hypothetical protein n=1 Tax=Caballeronia sp. TF1N1 TaxID=2878153 RepID=UPI00351D2BBF